MSKALVFIAVSAILILQLLMINHKNGLQLSKSRTSSYAKKIAHEVQMDSSYYAGDDYNFQRILRSFGGGFGGSFHSFSFRISSPRLRLGYYGYYLNSQRNYTGGTINWSLLGIVIAIVVTVVVLCLVYCYCLHVKRQRRANYQGRVNGSLEPHIEVQEENHQDISVIGST